MERRYINMSTVCKYDKASKNNAIAIVQRYADFSDYMGTFFGFITNDLPKEDMETIYKKINLLGQQVSRQFFRIIASNNANFNKVTMPNIDLFQQMYDKIRNGKTIDGQKLTSKDLADAFVSSLEECIDRNHEAEREIGLIPINEPSPIEAAGLSRGISSYKSTYVAKPRGY